MMKKYPKLSQECAGDGELTLHCPNCDSYYLHHKNAEVFNRAEDASVGTHITTGSKGANVDQDISANPSSRRDAISVHFYCEGCSADIRLDIIQHKGVTNLSMTFSEK